MKAEITKPSSSTGYDDEIDLIELFKVLWAKKVFIIGITVLVTVAAALYASLKTPIYQVKSTIEVGHTQTKGVNSANRLLDNAAAIAVKIESAFPNKNPSELQENGILLSAKVVRGNNKTIDIITQALSNEVALEKNKQALEFVQEEYQTQIDSYISKVNTEIDFIQSQINYVNDVEKSIIEQDIQDINNRIEIIDSEIDLIKDAELPKAENKIAIILESQLKHEKFSLLKTLERKNTELKVHIQNKIRNLEKEIILEQEYLAEGSYKNNELIGDYIVSNNPVKPKKKLIVAVGFILGLFASVFLVLLMNFIRNENNKG